MQEGEFSKRKRKGNDMEGAIFIALLLVLLLGLIPASIAKSKGRSYTLWYFYGVFLFIFALIHALLISANEKAIGKKKCPGCASIIPAEAIICPSCRTALNGASLDKDTLGPDVQTGSVGFSGERALSSVKYQLFLTNKYSIIKNATLEKYIIDDDSFDSLSDSLNEADRRYSTELAFIEKQRIETELVLSHHKLKTENDEKIRLKEIEDERAEIRKRMEIEAPFRAANQRKANIVIFVVAIVGIAIASTLLYKRHEQTARLDALQADEAKRNELAAKRAKATLQRKKELEVETNAQLFDMFAGNNFFGFRVGDNNLMLLDQKAKIEKMEWKGNQRSIWKDGAFNYITYTNTLSDLIEDKKMADRISSISFSYCSRGNKPLNLSDKSSYSSMKLIGVYIKLESEIATRDFDLYAYHKAQKLGDSLKKLKVDYKFDFNSKHLVFEDPIRNHSKNPYPFPQKYSDPCENPYEYS